MSSLVIKLLCQVQLKGTAALRIILSKEYATGKQMIQLIATNIGIRFGSSIAAVLANINNRSSL